ncbi:MAG: hypothetical protein VKK32_09455 [Candidatus Melainabacteria bacterium]|nr:hypothetical protein [Candidatus Melainabacteria bacterium]
MLGIILNSAIAVVASALIPTGDGEAPKNRVYGIDPEMPPKVDQGNQRIQDRLMQSMMARAAEMFSSVEGITEREKREQEKRRRVRALQSKARQKEVRKLKVRGRRFLRDLSGK